MDALQYEQINIEKLNLSGRAYNSLKRAGINTLQDLLSAYEQEKLLNIRNLGMKSYEEIRDAILDFTREDFQIEDESAVEESEESYTVPEEIEDIPIYELKLSGRLRNGLARGGFNTVGKLVRMTSEEMMSVRGMGAKTIDELQSIIREIKEEGIEYFDEDRAKDAPIDERHRRTIDIEIANRLREDYGFKSVWLTEWYNVTRSRIQQILNKRRNHGNWLNRELTPENQELLLDMVKSKAEIAESTDGTKAYFLSNRKDDCAVVFVTDEEIKCFFMEMLPEDIQEAIRESRLDCLSFEELEIISSGKTISILKEVYFCPENTGRFRQFANLRGMSANEYCVFLTGMNYATAQSTVDDTKIVEFLNAHYTNGRLMIPANNSTQWFRSFISRNGYTIDEIADMYGFNDKQEEDEVQKCDAVEDDMQRYEILSDDWLDKLFAENPLIGNKILSEKTKEKLFGITKGYIDKRLREPWLKFPIAAKKQIALAVITYAKEWDTGDESGFWKYITAQFGYRDETNQLRGILCDCVLDATVKSHRWFVSSATGYQYKSTIVIHALTTKHSWMLLYDFLFDFYKTNMKWTYIEDDLIIARMVTALRSKLIAGDEADDDNLEISTKVYYFQEGIRKLIIYRTGYAIKLINHMLGRIDGIINHMETPAKLYVDELCDQWIEGKLNSARESRAKSSSSTGTRSVAIDYTRIRPTYSLRNEKDVVITFPDVRLKKTEFEKVELQVYVGDTNVETKSLSFYGNELGKTLSGFSIDMNMCLRRGDGSLRIRAILRCDDEEIYDSKDTLYRECLCFNRERECDVRECEKGSYSFFVTTNCSLEFSGAEVSDIDAGSFWHSYYARLGQGFWIKLDDQIMSFDSGDSVSSSGGIRAIYPSVDTEAVFIKNGRKYNIVSKESEILLIVSNMEDLRKCAMSMNSKKVELSSMSPEETANGLIYKIPMQQEDDKTCEFQIVDLEKNRIVSREAIKVIPGLSVRFNRAFYVSDKDFEGAIANVSTASGLERFDINSGDEVISFAADGGTIEIKVPRVIVRDDAGQKWRHGYTTWLKDIRQNEKIYMSLPSGCSACMKVGDIDVTEDPKGCFDFGNATFAYSGSDDSEWINIRIVVSNGQTSQEYIVGRISVKERFKDTVQFDYRDNTLFWNRGMGFIGNSDSSFRLKIETEEGTKEYPLNLDDEEIVSKPDIPLKEYRCQIVKESENIFLGDETILHTGLVLIGDKNELRFHNCMIEITNITCEEDGDLRSVDIKNTYIDQIEYKGIQFVDSEDRECPVYSGVLFFMGQSLKHHEFSYEECISEKGFQLYKINPVKIVYINEHTLSITNEDDDGIYYYRHFDKMTMANRYSITDREPNARNQSTYYLADLYTYRKERMN